MSGRGAKLQQNSTQFKEGSQSSSVTHGQVTKITSTPQQLATKEQILHQ
jgi:hypothetical protein